MSCSICLDKLKEPVSVPCGHVYCTDCLTNHVTTTSADGFTSTCPSCREPFNMVRPELTCLPRKFHAYILPSIRRVYIEPHRETLRKKLAASEARVAALEEDKERLMAECERHIAAARAHALGETDALRRLRAVELGRVEQEENAASEMHDAEQALKALKLKYDKMKRHVRALEASRFEENDENTIADALIVAGKRNTSAVDLSVEEAATPKRLRVIRPIPRSRQNLQTPHKSALPLGSPFRT